MNMKLQEYQSRERGLDLLSRSWTGSSNSCSPRWKGAKISSTISVDTSAKVGGFHCRKRDTLSNTLMRREFFLTKNSRYNQAALKGKEPHIQLPLDRRFGFAEIHLNKYLTPHTEIGRQDLNGPSLRNPPLQR